MKNLSISLLFSVIALSCFAQGPPRRPVAGPPGQPGRPGDAATIGLLPSKVGPAGSQITVRNAGTSSNALFEFTTPDLSNVGSAGTNGSTGNQAATSITPGTENLQVVKGSGNDFTITDLYYQKGAKVIMGTTRAHIAAALASIPSSETAMTNFIVLGKFDFAFSGGFLNVNKKVAFWGMNNAEFAGGTVNSDLLAINGTNTQVQFHNIKFSSYKTGTGYALIYMNEVGTNVDELTVEDCYFTCPAGDFNALGGSAWNGSNGMYYSNITIRRNKFIGIGRMPIELHAHKNDGDVRIKYVNINDNFFKGSGLNDQYGMCVSLSGDVQYVTGLGNQMYDFKYCGWELISVQDAVIGGTIMQTDIANTNGYSLTDGGSTEFAGNPGHEARNIHIYGDNIMVAGRAFNCFYAKDVKLSNCKWRSTLFSQFQHAKDFDINNLSATSSDQFTLRFEDFQTGNIRQSVVRNTRTAGGGPLYEAVSFGYNSSNNTLTDIWVYTAKSSDNGAYVKFDGGTGNSQTNVRYNGTKMADF